MSIHPTAIIEKSVRLAEGVSVGPYAVIRGDVSIGANSSIDAHAVIEGWTDIGEGVSIGVGSVIGNAPQDLKYAGEETRVEIGSGTVIREYVTINRGTSDRKKTSVGKNALLMSYVHIAHDCIVGDGVILSNCATLAGHVTVEKNAIIGGLTPVHQFASIGAFSFVGGASRIAKDVPPFCKVAGSPVRLAGINSVGLKRRNFSEDEIAAISQAYRILFRSKMNISQALEVLESDPIMESENVKWMVRFVRASKRGVYNR
ncbi:MAG: acyl-ACP--UDP-N-acetylglucosamine O-acyltransferase [Elusimicrobia bacterium]|nr:acyl-ACP--UDP-N-acetylglucosamine O-acyltransferase [Elusimicrobiota bacterium]